MSEGEPLPHVLRRLDVQLVHIQPHERALRANREVLLSNGNAFHFPQGDRLNVTLSEPELRVLVFGDTGSLLPQQREVAQAMRKFAAKRGCQLALVLGDLFYETGVESVNDPRFNTAFEELYAPLAIPHYVVLGNHDYGNGVIERSADPYLSFAKAGASRVWTMPDRYYQFSYSLPHRKVEFFALDTTHFTPEQAYWLAHQLDMSQADEKSSGVPVTRIVYGHHPIYSFGMHGHGEALVESLLPILRNRVQAYLCGHEHDQQLLTRDASPWYLVSGTAGQEPRSVRCARRIHGDACDTLHAEARPGFTCLTIRAHEFEVEILNTTSPEESFCWSERF